MSGPSQRNASTTHTPRGRVGLWPTLAFVLAATSAIVTALLGGGAASAAKAAVAAAPKTVFQCQKKYHVAANQERCIKQLPGSSCAHPLEIQKSSSTRGDTRYIKATLKQVPYEEHDGATAYLTWAPRAKNVAICPFPRGAVFKSFRLKFNASLGRQVETEIENVPVHTTTKGGRYEYSASSEEFKDFYLVVRAYFIHPPQ